MLQQTQVQAVLPYYQKWMKLFPNVQTLASAPLQKVLKSWQGLGYYRRAQNLWQAARLLVEKYGGQLPANYDELRRLPGFGPYTTAAVLSLAYGQPYPVIEANVRRVLMRLAGWKTRAFSSSDRKWLALLEFFFPTRKAKEFNQAMMELGGLVCKPRHPRCHLCPIQRFCAAFARGEQETIPPLKTLRSEKIQAVVAIFRKNGKYLIQKRPERGLFGGLWEFPGGKRKTGETLEEALQREIKEELGAEIEAMRFLLSVDHAYTRFHVKLHAFACRFRSRPHLDNQRHRWVSLSSLRKYPFPSGSAKVVEYLKNHSDPTRNCR